MENFINNTKQPFTVIMNDVLQEETIFENANQKLCYLYLYSLKNCSSVFPSHETIAKAVCCSVSTVKRILQGLQELNLLKIKSRPGQTSIYILNDYHEVVQNNLGQNELVQHELGGQLKLNQEVGQNRLLKLKNKNKITKNKISSRESIDNELRILYPDTFEQVKEEILNDSTLIINTDKQYRSMLLYRLKSSKEVVKEKPKQRKAVRSEVLPTWFEEYQRGQQKYEIEQKSVKPIDIEELRRELSKYSH